MGMRLPYSYAQQLRRAELFAQLQKIEETFGPSLRDARARASRSAPWEFDPEMQRYARLLARVGELRKPFEEELFRIWLTLDRGSYTRDLTPTEAADGRGHFLLKKEPAS